jgi:DNA-binding CsgD family transcriptional regulator
MLSDRELEVYQLLGAGRTTRQIAGALHLSVKTIETHRENLKHKLGLANATALVQHATTWVQGLRSPDSSADSA